MKIREEIDRYGARLIFEDVNKKESFYYDKHSGVFLMTQKDYFSEIRWKLRAAIIGESGYICVKAYNKAFLEDILSAVGHYAIDNSIPIECNIRTFDIENIYSLKKAVEKTNENIFCGRL